MQNLPYNTKPLEPRQKLFCDEYLKDLNATAAAKRVGYKPKNADNTGYKILALPQAKAYIQLGLDKMAEEARMSARIMTKELMDLAKADIRDFVDEHGNVKNLNDIPEHLLKGVQVQIKKKEKRNGRTVITTCQLNNRIQLMEHLTKNFDNANVVTTAQPKYVGPGEWSFATENF